MTTETEQTKVEVSTKRDQNLKLGIKIIFIAVITLLLLIPQAVITHLIDERQRTRIDAQEEIASSWGGTQRVAGPAIVIPKENNNDVILLPSELKISGNLATQALKRGIFNINVFNAPLTLTGEFSIPAEKLANKLDDVKISGAYLFVGIKDLRGLTDNVNVDWGGQQKHLESCASIGSGLSCPIDVTPILDGGKVRFTIKVPLKGSDGINFCPLGNTTTVKITSDWGSPSFNGHYLPTQRSITDSSFSATWKVLDVNRDFGQVNTNFHDWTSLMNDSQFGVELHTQVDQYQQTTRTVKYAFLIILLTFGVVLFVDLRKRTNIHPVQYLLIGVALMLFYTLLLSFSEHIAFSVSYIIAAIMTIGLISIFMQAIVKNWKVSGGLCVLLTALFIFIYILLQLETYALLAGSIGLFVILGVAMFATIKIREQ